MRLEDAERASVIIHRAPDAPLVVANGMNVLVRGVVNQDLSIAEDPGFGTTDVGEGFDLALHCDAAKVLKQAGLAPIFNAA